MKSELFHHVRIAPLHQQRVLARTQPSCAAARQLRLLDQRAETVKFADAGLCNPLHSLCFAQRFQRQKPARRRQFKTIADSRGKRCRQVRRGVFQVLNCPGFDQAKGRLQRAVKSVLARCHRDVTQTGQFRLTCFTAMHNIPAEPGRAEIHQCPYRRYIVNRKSRV